MDAHSGTVSTADRTALLRVNEVAALLAIGRRTVYTLVSSGELPTVRVGSRIRFRLADIEAYLERSPESGP